MSRATNFEPVITLGTAYDAIVPEVVLRHSVVLEPKTSVSGTQTVTPGTIT